MIFKFLQKPITITAVVSESFAFAQKYYPIVPSSKFIPEWWKNTPKSNFDLESFNLSRTVRGCPGIIGSFKNGYIQPMWSDVAFSHENENNWRFSFADNMSRIDMHSNTQFTNFYENYSFMKMSSPWFLRAPKNLKIFMVDPFYLTNEPKPYIIPYGFLEGSSISLNYFFFMKKNQGVEKILIKAGTPTVQIIPLTDKTIKFTTEIISNREYELMKRTHIVPKFSNSGIERRKLLSRKKD